MGTFQSFHFILELIMAFSARLKHGEQGEITRKIRDVEKLFYERANGLMLFTMEKQ